MRIEPINLPTDLANEVAIIEIELKLNEVIKYINEIEEESEAILSRSREREKKY